MQLSSRLALSTAAIALLASPTAQAGSYYVSLFGGLSTFDDEVSFKQSTSNSSFVPNHFLSTTVLGGGLNTYFFKTGATKYTTPTGTMTFYTTYASSTRTIGFYSTIGNVFGSTSNLQRSAFAWKDDFETGFVVGASVGNELARNWRAELELAYRSADIDSGGRFMRANSGSLIYRTSIASATRFNYRYAYSTSSIVYTTTATYGGPVDNGTATQTIFASSTALGSYAGTTSTVPTTGTTVGNFNSNGQAEVWSLMANLWYDFDLGDSNLRPFIGGGIGVANVDVEYSASMATFFGGTARYSVDDSGAAFAYQVGAGIGYDLGDGMMLSAQYRWFGTTDVDVGNSDLKVESHNVIVGLNIPLGGGY